MIELVWEQQPMIGIRKHLYLRRGLIESACVRAPASDLSPLGQAMTDEILAEVVGSADVTRELTLKQILGE